MLIVCETSLCDGESMGWQLVRTAAPFFDWECVLKVPVLVWSVAATVEELRSMSSTLWYVS